MHLFNLLKVLLLGVVEGITEWLPISSTGHLILLEELFELSVSPAFQELFEVVVQLGAILAVLLLSRRDLDPLSSHKSTKEKKDTLRLWALILLGVIPSAIAGFLLDDLLSEHLYNPLTVSLALILWGIGFLVIERIQKNRSPRITSTAELTPIDSLSVGLFQVCSLIPGTSRSGATILGGLLCGFSRPLAARISFFLAIPTMAGASLLKGIKFLLEGNRLSSEEGWLLLVGTAAAFLTSLVTLRFLMDYVRKHSFFAFGVYRILLGIGVLAYFIAEN